MMDGDTESLKNWICSTTEGDLARSHPLQSHLWRNRGRMYDSDLVNKPFFDEGLRVMRERISVEAASPMPSQRTAHPSQNHSHASSTDYATTTLASDSLSDNSPRDIDELSDYVLRCVAEYELHPDPDDVSPGMARAMLPPTVDEVAGLVASVALVSYMSEEDCRDKLASSVDTSLSSQGAKRMRPEAMAPPPLHALGDRMSASVTTRPTVSGPRAPHPRLPPAAPDSERDAAAGGALKNRFKSAKQQHVEEGGVLKRKDSANGGAPMPAKGASASAAIESSDIPEELQQFDKAIVQKIMSDIVSQGQPITFDDISGLEFAKKCVQELICWPILRPDIFTGLRALPKGLLLFGPPGTGKTLIGKAIAHETGATFFSISASSLTSKWIGEGEAGVRTLFALAAFYQPSVVFIDEVDSLLSQRSSEENEASRRIKTEFLIQLDGVGGSRDARVVIIGATNRPQELDEAARRRFVKRIYIPLPDKDSRVKIIENLLRSNKHRLDKVGVDFIAERTSGFSGADMSALCTEAAMCPLRELASKHMGDLRSLRESDVPPINREHFEEALQSVSCSVSQGDLQQYVDWNALYGTYKRME